MRPPIELMKTMRPRPRRISGSVAWVTATWAVRLTSTWRRKSSSGSVSPRPAVPGFVAGPLEPGSGLFLDPLRRSRDLIGIGDVEGQRHDPLGAGLAERVGVLLPANAGEDLPAGGVQALDRRPADAGGSSGDQNRAHAPRP